MICSLYCIDCLQKKKCVEGGGGCILCDELWVACNFDHKKCISANIHLSRGEAQCAFTLKLPESGGLKQREQDAEGLIFAIAQGK